MSFNAGLPQNEVPAVALKVLHFVAGLPQNEVPSKLLQALQLATMFGIK